MKPICCNTCHASKVAKDKDRVKILRHVYHNSASKAYQQRASRISGIDRKPNTEKLGTDVSKVSEHSAGFVTAMKLTDPG